METTASSPVWFLSQRQPVQGGKAAAATGALGLHLEIRDGQGLCPSFWMAMFKLWMKSQTVFLWIVSVSLLMLVATRLSPMPSNAQPAAAEARIESDGGASFLPAVLYKGSQLQMWVSAGKLADLPTSGPAWNNVLEGAQQDTSRPKHKRSG